MKRILLLFLLAVMPLLASTDSALAAYKKGEYKEAFTLYEAEAKKGDTTAQNALSYLYFNGIGTQKDSSKGLKWLKKAAQSGDARAAFDLGMMYLSGTNVKRDMKQAAKYLQIAADKKNAEAQYNLALMYYNGDGVKQDVKKAALLLEEAANSGHQGAKRNVGRVYMQVLDFKKAKYWLNENLKDGDPEAATLLKEIEAAKK
jgi:TPR repeat protein